MMLWKPFTLSTVVFVLSLCPAFLACSRPESEPASGKMAAVEPVVDQGCGHQNGAECQKEQEPSTASSQSEGPRLYGEPLDSSVPEVHLAEILKSPEQYHQKVVKVEGLVKRACTRKGCWMEIAPTATPEVGGCRVTFKDYGFLVPTDSKGRHATLVGAVQVTEIPQAAVAHYESEGARFSDKQADGSAHEVRIVATGVELSGS